MQKVSPLRPRLRQTTLPFGAASFHLALMPSEKTGGFASTATKTTIPSSIVGILALLRVAGSTLNLANLATMTHTHVDKHAWSATAETTNLLARTTTRKIVAIFQDQGQVNRHNATTYTSDHHDGILRSPASSAPAPAPRMRFGAAHNSGENTLARQPGTFRNSNRPLDGDTAPSTILSGGTYFGFRRCLCSITSLPSNAAQISSVKSPRAPTPSADNSHIVVPAAGTSASNVVSSSQLIFFFFDGENARFQRRSSRPWSEFGDGNRASSAVSLNRGSTQQWGYALQTPPPSTMARERALCALPPQARVAQQYSCGDGASPFYAYVFIPPSP